MNMIQTQKTIPQYTLKHALRYVELKKIIFYLQRKHRHIQQRYCNINIQITTSDGQI